MALPTELHPLHLGGNDINAFKVANSLRFRNTNSAYLLRSFPSAGNRKTWTFSCWVKRGFITSGLQTIFGSYTSGTDTTALCLELHSDDTLRVVGWSTIFRTTTQVFRDPTAWYHIVWAFDSTQATASNRSRIYINGTEITVYTTNNAFTQNTDYGINQAGNHSLGVYHPAATTGYGYLDGYLAEVNFIDGQQLTPSAFAQTDVLTGAWNPKKYSGTYGTNGFYLPFNTSSTSFAATFNGSSQYLTTSTNANLALGTSDFTIEYWVNFTAATNGGTVCCAGSGAPAFEGLFGYVNSSQLQTYLTSTGSSWDIAAARVVISSITLGRWYHVAYTRSGSTFRVFVDGTQVDTFTSAASIYQSANQFSLCRGQNTGLINGLLSNVRVIRGTALYTANFTPSTQPLTAVTNTQLLTLQNSTIIDNSPNALSITNTGSVATATNSPFGLTVVGADSSGNGNQWTSSGITISSSANTVSTTHDLYTDVPANWDDGGNNRGNYCTMCILDNAGQTWTISEGNLRLYQGNFGSYVYTAKGTMAVNTGKWYFETYINSNGSGNEGAIGVMDTSWQCGFTGYSVNPTVFYLRSNGNIYQGSNGSSTSTLLQSPGTTATVGDLIGVAFDVDAKTISFYKNGTIIGISQAFTLTTGNYVAPAHRGYYYSDWSFNFGQRPFRYTPPTGYKALNSYNLPKPSLPLV